MVWVEVYGGQRSLAFELTTAKKKNHVCNMYVYLTLWLVHLGQLGQGKTISPFAGAYGSSKGVNFFLTRTLAKVDNCIQIPSSFENLI